ncbi:zinc finger protein 232-like [Zootoca vivipara]|uniref:zinc finger protein 232-like n=1 Tax=Zootoca vivipara TaxID=8524 RepID=UPI00293B88E3|nr:zinc finger protein 232-like [Zootoca vivipara]
MEAQRQSFRWFRYQEAEGPREVCSRLWYLCHQWLKPERHIREQIVEFVILEQFLAGLPPEMQSWVQEGENQHRRGALQVLRLREEVPLEHEPHCTPEDLHGRGEPHECLTCGKSFSHSQNFARHQGLHHRKKPHDCVNCGKSFRWSSNLDIRQTIHAGEEPFECADCGKTFSYKLRLSRHQRVHAGNERFKCPLCWASFAFESSLTRHQGIHCGKSFSDEQNLLAHQIIQTGSSCINSQTLF